MFFLCFLFNINIASGFALISAAGAIQQQDIHHARHSEIQENQMDYIDVSSAVVSDSSPFLSPHCHPVLINEDAVIDPRSKWTAFM